MNRTIVFDLGGVIIDLDVARCVAAFRRLMTDEAIRTVLGIDDEGEAVVAISAATRQLMHDYEYGNISSQAFISSLLEYCHPGVTEAQVCEAWMSMLGDLPEERLRYIRSLRQQGYQTVLLSNSNDLHWQYIFRRYALADCFDFIFASHLLHMAKPNPDIFRHVAEAVRMDPASTIYIDDLEKNRLAGHLHAGWQTLPSLTDLQNMGIKGK